MTAPILRVEEIRLYERDVAFRMPFRFGVVTLTACPQAVARVRVSKGGAEAWGMAAEMLARYRAAFADVDGQAFAASYAALGAQRNTKIIGNFTRLCRRDGKPHYLPLIPRVWRLLEGDLAHPALAPLRDWFERALPPEMRSVPEERAAS